MTKRIITLMLAVCMLVSVMPNIAFAAGELTLPNIYKEYFPNISTKTPFRPVHQYLYRQNPPTFTWPAIDGAESYDVIVCADEALTDVRYEKKGVKDNFILFDTTFEENVYYWWALRYHKGSEVSEWSIARRFKLASDSVELIFPTKERVLEAIPQSHPRFFFTQETLPQVKEDILSSPTAKKYLEEVLTKTVAKNIANGVQKEPEIKNYAELVAKGPAASSAYGNGGRSAAQNIGNAAMDAALLYNLTGDTAAADYAVQCLMEFADWEWKDPNAPTSFEVNDLGYYEAITYPAIAYDWIYNYMTQEQREKIAGMIRGRVDARFRKLMDSLKRNPYESHTWSYCSYFGMGIIALLYDQEGTLDMYDEWFGVYNSNFNPLSIEDGAYGKGINYWLSAYGRDSLFHDAMTYAGVFNFYDIPFYKNQYLYGIYNYPKDSNVNSWGDGGNVGQSSLAQYIATGASRSAKFTKQPELLWWRNQTAGNFYNNVSQFGFDSIFYMDTDDMEDRAPIDYPRDYCFIDNGLTSMHSDLVNTPRTSLYFRSGMYGSFNHTQSDINSFMIEVAGEELAWKSGYYDTYGSTHHVNFSKTTPAHNTITVDNGIGQPINQFDADGRTTMFLTNTDMSAVVGEGADAYMGKLGKYDRTLIYLRPDSYIVIDNLAASELKKQQNGSTFEWWLNCMGTVDVHDDMKGAHLENNTVALDARVHYPEKVTPYYSNLFSGTDLIDWPTDDRKQGAAYHSRVWFQTEKVKETKMVVTMDSRGINEEAEKVKANQYENYMELEFDDGSMAYVSLATDETTMIDTGEYKFNGTAVVHNDDYLMFIGGTELYIRGQKVIEADRPVAVTMGSDEFGVSCYVDDYNITVYPNELYMPNPETVLFRDGRETEMGLGMQATIDPETKVVTVKADKGHYSMLMNGKGLPGEQTGEVWSYTLVVDGKETTQTIDNIYYNADYESEGSGVVVNSDLIPDTEYKVVEATSDISLSGAPVVVGEKILMKNNGGVRLTADNQRVVLQSIPNVQCEVDYTTDYDSVANAATYLIQAESATRYVGATRQTSGIETVGVSQLNLLTDRAYYKVKIEESGNYKFSVRYAAWQEPYPSRFIEIEDIRYYFKLPDSGGYGANVTDFDVVTLKENIYLEAGEYEFFLGANGVGAWNYDWIAFTKAD